MTIVHYKSSGAMAPEIMQKLGIDGIQIVASKPEEFRQLMANDVGRWLDLVKTPGIKISE